MKLFIFPLALMASLAFVSCNNEEKPKDDPGTPASNETAPEGARTALATSMDVYSSGTDTLVGYTAWDSAKQGKRPGILIVHEWWGNNDYSKKRAKELAQLGYVAMAVDMFGNAKTAATPDEAMKLAGPFYSNPALGKARLDAALAKLKSNPQVDTSKIAAIGYCFGGSMVLNYAKQGADIDGVVSFHGGLQGVAPEKGKTKAQILVCHGAADSFVPDADSVNFRKQLDDAGVSYDFRSYSGAKHAFTNPDATAKGQQFKLDIAYNEEADKNSWRDMRNFFEKVFK